MVVPAYLFEPLVKRGPRGHAAMVWVHGGVHGQWGSGLLPFVKEAVQRGYVIVTPDYRGSTGYGKDHYLAIDYGGREIDDVESAVAYLKTLPYVDPDRIGIMGWSHGGFIAAHVAMRKHPVVKASAAIVPVTNLVFRLSYKGPGYQRSYAAESTIKGLPFEKPEEYIKRSPLYHVEDLSIPLLVHVSTNDQDVNYVEDQQLVWKLRALKPDLSETMVYTDPAPWGAVGRPRLQPPGGSGHARARGLAGTDRLVEPDVDVLRLVAAAVRGPFEAAAAGTHDAVGIGRFVSFSSSLDSLVIILVEKAMKALIVRRLLRLAASALAVVSASAAAVILAPGVLQAQATGVIRGTVTAEGSNTPDRGGAGLPGWQPPVCAHGCGGPVPAAGHARGRGHGARAAHRIRGADAKRHGRRRRHPHGRLRAQGGGALAGRRGGHRDGRRGAQEGSRQRDGDHRLEVARIGAGDGCAGHDRRARGRESP